MIFFISCLAVWRLCHLLAEEDGPWGIVYRIRKRLGNSQLGRLMDCVGCSSMWISIPVALLISNMFIITWLSLSAMTMLIETVYELLWKKAKDIGTGLFHGEIQRSKSD
jgi:hypothetical protein